MFSSHLAADALAAMLKVKPEEAKAKKGAIFDSVENGDTYTDASDFAHNDIALKSVAALQQWAEADDLEDGEDLATRLSMMMVGIADADLDGEISDAEWGVMQIALETAWDYLAGKGVSEEDIDALLNNWDNDAAVRIQELLASRLPDGDEASGDDMDSFVFGDGSDEAAFDSAVLDATYKMKVAIRGGKKVRIKKRISGTVRLSAKQKIAIRKAQRKAFSAGAMMKRAKSMRIRQKMMGGK